MVTKRKRKGENVQIKLLQIQIKEQGKMLGSKMENELTIMLLLEQIVGLEPNNCRCHTQTSRIML